MTESTHLPWNEGLPTKPDVDALLKAFPPESIKPGEWRVIDDQVRTAIGKADGVRYKTITSAWRRRLLNDYAVTLFRQESVGFFCPTPEEVFAKTHPTYEYVGRAIGRQMKHVAVVKPQTDAQRAIQEHQGRLLYTTKRVLRKDRMNVLPPTAAAERPKIEAPKAKT